MVCYIPFIIPLRDGECESRGEGVSACIVTVMVEEWRGEVLNYTG